MFYSNLKMFFSFYEQPVNSYQELNSMVVSDDAECRSNIDGYRAGRVEMSGAFGSV